jgi:hypothetical protein
MGLTVRECFPTASAFGAFFVVYCRKGRCHRWAEGDDVRRRTWTAGILGFGLILGVPVIAEDDPGEGAGGHVQSAEYIGVQGIAGFCTVHKEVSIGNACFALQGNSSRLHMMIDDDFFSVVQGMYRLFDGPLDDPLRVPNKIEEGYFCTEGGIDLPPAAHSVAVYMDGHVGTQVFCDSLQGASLGTVTITEE